MTSSAPTKLGALCKLLVLQEVTRMLEAGSFSPSTAGSAWKRVLFEQRWPLALWLLALVIRLHWNLEIHPPSLYDYSDMHGYVQRADELLDDPYKVQRYAAFFPFGTTWLLAVVKYWFGRDNGMAIGVFYAIAGSLIVPLSYAIARKSELPEYIAKISASLLVIYYPLIALGGYTLSEIPASLSLCFSVWCLLSLYDRPRLSMALLLGASWGVACTIRSQMVVNIALVGGFYWILRRSDREAMRKIQYKHILAAALPLALCLGLCSYRVKYHTGQWGLVSTNGPINLIFGRCHTHSVSAQGKRGWGRFGPPPMIQLESYGRKHDAIFMKLWPVFADYPEPVPGVPGFKINGPLACAKGCRAEGVDVQYDGYIGDTETQNKIVRACLERTSIWRQLAYSLQHCILLWDFNMMWPDSANPAPRPVDEGQGWKALTSAWRYFHNIVLAVPSLAAAFFVLLRPKGKSKLALIALNFVSVLVVAAIVMGGVRFRSPYDPLILILAVAFWSAAYKKWTGRGPQD